MSAFVRPSAPPRKSLRPVSKDGEKQQIWVPMLNNASKGKDLAEKQLLILGGSPEQQQEFLEHLNPAPSRIRFNDRQQSRKAPISNRYALGYTYHNVLDADQEDVLARLNIYMLSNPSAAFAPLLKPLFAPQTAKETLVTILLDWSDPFRWARQLRQWIRLLRRVIASLDDETKIALEENINDWKEKRVGVLQGPGEWDEALGVPLSVVCIQSEKSERLERDLGWHDEHFDFLTQWLRCVLLKHGASLVYTATFDPNNVRTLLHSSLSIHSLLKREVAKPNYIEREKILIPPNWDSWGKIRPLREGTDLEAISEAWTVEIQTSPEDEPNLDSSQPTTETDTAVSVYESTLPQPLAATATQQSTTQEDETPLATVQEFLASQLTILESLKADDEKAARKAASSTTSRRIATTGTSSITSSSDAGRMADQIGPYQINVNGIDFDAEEATRRLKEREAERNAAAAAAAVDDAPVQQTPVSRATATGSGVSTPTRRTGAAASGAGEEGKASNEAMSAFFQNLIKKDRRTPAGNRDGGERQPEHRRITYGRFLFPLQQLIKHKAVSNQGAPLPASFSAPSHGLNTPLNVHHPRLPHQTVHNRPLGQPPPTTPIRPEHGTLPPKDFVSSMPANLPTPPFIFVPGIPNFRDLGGYACPPPAQLHNTSIINTTGTAPRFQIRRNILFRCAHPTQLSTQGLMVLDHLGVTDIFDLRSEPELKKLSAPEPDAETPFLKAGEGWIEVPGITRHFTPVYQSEDYGPVALAKKLKWYTAPLDGKGDGEKDLSYSEGFVSAYRDIGTFAATGGSYAKILRQTIRAIDAEEQREKEVEAKVAADGAARRRPERPGRSQIRPVSAYADLNGILDHHERFPSPDPSKLSLNGRSSGTATPPTSTLSPQPQQQLQQPEDDGGDPIRTNGGLIFHCTAGKDRTGVLAALILYLCGVDMEDIAWEYAITEPGLGSWRRIFIDRISKSGMGSGGSGKPVEQQQQQQEPSSEPQAATFKEGYLDDDKEKSAPTANGSPDKVAPAPPTTAGGVAGAQTDVLTRAEAARICGSRAGNIRRFLTQVVDGEWGGVEAYLTGMIGLSQEEVERLKSGLVVRVDDEEGEDAMVRRRGIEGWTLEGGMDDDREG
ncbi:Cytoplasmic dynein 1 light intermediate chain 2 [Cyphellophora attinorum]|uniref:Cytoplasmic dynein 1 light intermediate chain 2 n=1 Tax=Cyphellophora attinorum TaxID=1664694 RepID=A0A0N1H7N3_9EURO|nr:Cytoplasmic dynein 1 light intermediate chain 2 [Phialophora attinorum]KPI42570.1 Cytoplasmic dynein 1 light intermediate chain 2 [Phialophora attinorum]